MSWDLFLCNELLCGDATLQPSFWHVFGDEGKNTVSWKVHSFLLLTIDATKSIMNLYKPSKFKMRTEDTEISLRNLTFTQMEDIISSLCPSHHQTHRLGGRWQGDTHQHQLARAELLEIRAGLHQVAEHRKQAGRDMPSLEMQRISNQDPCHRSSETEPGFYTLQVGVHHTRADSSMD